MVKFAPTSKGLHALNLKENPDAAYLLVNNADLAYQNSPVATVWANYEVFTKCQIKQAIEACHLMSMIGAPTEHKFQGVVRINLLKDCPITTADIVHANKIFGSPDLTNLRGKTVCKPEPVRTKYVDIPCVILDVHGRVTLMADVMFVNGIPFLVSSSRNIKLFTIEHVPQRTASKLGYLFQWIINVYIRNPKSVTRNHRILTIMVTECHATP